MTMERLLVVALSMFMLCFYLVYGAGDTQAAGTEYVEGVDRYMSTTCTPPTHRAKDHNGENKPITHAEMDRTEIVLSQNSSMSPETHTILVMDIFCTNKFDLHLLKDGGQWWKSARIRDTTGQWSDVSLDIKGFVWTMAAAPPVEPPAELAPDIPPDAWVVAYASSYEADNWLMPPECAFNRGTPCVHDIWHSQYTPTEAQPPHELVIDMGQTYSVSSFQQQPRPSGGNAVAKDYSFQVSTNGVLWDQVAGGTFPPGTDVTTVTFPETDARYIKFVCLSEQDGGNQCSVDELYVQGVASGIPVKAPPKPAVITE